MPNSPRTQAALRLLSAGLTWRIACEQAGISQSTLARAIKRGMRPHCPFCGQPIKEVKHHV